MQMYEPYRQADLATLQAEYDRLAQMYADEYAAAERLARWHGSEYDARVAQAAAAYQAKMAQLEASIGQQVAGVNQHYDARERGYDQVMNTPWQPHPDPMAPGAAPEIAPAPEPPRDWLGSLLGLFS